MSVKDALRSATMKLGELFVTMALITLMQQLFVASLGSLEEVS